jgi:membrane-associated phospholipid phosphatase
VTLRWMTAECRRYCRGLSDVGAGDDAIQADLTQTIGSISIGPFGTQAVIVDRPAARGGPPDSQSGFIDLRDGPFANALCVLRTGVWQLEKLDESLLRVLRTRCHGPALEGAVVRFSRLGEHSRLWMSVALAGAASDRKNRSLYLRLLATLMATEVVNALVKLAIDRPRPMLPGLSPLMSTRSGRSFPSAHASTSFAATGLLTQVLPSPPVYLAAGAMALSRPYLGVHYPSDVIAGVALGIVLGKIAGP